MNFEETLNYYIDKINCTSKQLADASHISQSVISRYRKGDRTPKYNSIQANAIKDGLISLAKKNKIDIDENKLKEEFDNTLNSGNIDFNTFKDNFNKLIDILNINVKSISKYIGFDASYLSKIRNGIRKPQNMSEFVDSICNYIVENYNDNISIEKISNLIGINISNNYYQTLYKWLSSNPNHNNNSINNFLVKLDEFDLNEYIKVIKFDELKVPTLPIQLPKSKTYYGLKGFKDSQLDVLKSIVLSKSKEDIYFYSNMSMIESSKDLDFTKKFMFGLACALKKGIHINMIHNLDRPFKEIMLGLEGWIPLYMTGQINPYYFKTSLDRIYSNIDISGGTAAMSGSYINSIDASKFYFTTKKDEVDYYRNNSKELIKKAERLVDIYTADKKHELDKFIDKCSNEPGNRFNICYNLPMYLISDKLLNTILDRNKISKKDKKMIIDYVEKDKSMFNKIVQNYSIVDKINILSKEEFEKSNMSLSLSNIFYNKKVLYNYDEYLEHIKLIKNFKNKNYSFIVNNKPIFKNINIYIINNKKVIISKENNPSIHFVFYHPKLVSAISKFEVQIIEKN